MIASLVATLADEASRSRDTISEIASRPEIELGEFNDASRKVPLTIDSPERNDVEEVTHWLQQRRGIVSLDVIFVYFEELEEAGTP